jgi:hypothetical protein
MTQEVFVFAAVMENSSNHFRWRALKFIKNCLKNPGEEKRN